MDFYSEKENSEDLGKDLTSTFVILRFMEGGGQKKHRTEHRESFVVIAIVRFKGGQLGNKGNVP